MISRLLGAQPFWRLLRGFALVLWCFGTIKIVHAFKQLPSPNEFSAQVHWAAPKQDQARSSKEKLDAYIDQIGERSASYSSNLFSEVFHGCCLVIGAAVLASLAAWISKKPLLRWSAAFAGVGFGLLLSGVAIFLSGILVRKAEYVHYIQREWPFAQHLAETGYSSAQFANFAEHAARGGWEMFSRISEQCSRFSFPTMIGVLILWLAFLFPARTPLPPPSR